MIEKIVLKNFKSHAHTEIELGSVTALVGPNSSGKTSVLQAIKLVGHFIDEGWDSWDEFSELIKQGESSSTITIKGKTVPESFFEEASWAFTLTVNREAKGISPSGVEQFAGQKDELSTIGRSYPLASRLNRRMTQLLSRPVFFKPWWEILSQPSYSTEPRPKLNSEGSNLASVVAYLKREEDDIFSSIEKTLNELVPNILKVRPRQTKISLSEKRLVNLNGTNVALDDKRDVLADILTFDTVSGKGIPASQLSEGSLLLLALLTAIHAADSTHLIMLDDLEHGLHPNAQHKLIQLLIKFAEEHQKQIIFTTHSPYVLDDLDAKDVWVMATDKEGISHYQQLSKGPNAEFALKVLTTGEFLDAEGEEWVLDQPVQMEPAHA